DPAQPHAGVEPGDAAQRLADGQRVEGAAELDAAAGVAPVPAALFAARLTEVVEDRPVAAAASAQVGEEPAEAAVGLATRAGEAPGGRGGGGAGRGRPARRGRAAPPPRRGSRALRRRRRRSATRRTGRGARPGATPQDRRPWRAATHRPRREPPPQGGPPR